MKRLLLLAALFGAVCSVRAQEARFDEAAILKKVEKLELDSQNPKKNMKTTPWLDLGKAYVEAATTPTMGLYRGFDQISTEVMFPKPEKGTETIGNVEYEKWAYPYFDLYMKDGSVFFWNTKKFIIDGALKKAVAAFEKAYEIDPKGSAAKVGEGLTEVANAYKQEADNLYAMRNYEPTAEAFAAAYDVQRHPTVNKVDTLCSFNAGYLYTVGKKFELGEKYLKDAIANNYDSNGDSFYYLFHCYYGQKKFAEAKQALLDGLTKFPKNTQILEGLISLYAETGEDPKEVIPFVQKGIENDPTNPDLWAGLGRVYDKLGDNAKAMEAFTKAVQLTPDDFNANFNFALMVLRVADDKTNAFNEKTFTSREDRDKEMAELNKAYEAAVAPLEKSLAANPKDVTTAELLKSVCFRLRDTSPEMMEKYNKYNELFKSLQE